MKNIQSYTISIELNKNFKKLFTLLLSQSIYNKATVMRCFFFEQ